MATEAQAQSFERCPNPKCKAARHDLRLVYEMQANHNILEESAGDLCVSESHWVEPPNGVHPLIRCLKCGEHWPVPKGTTVFLTHDEKKHRLFGPDHR